MEPDIVETAKNNFSTDRSVFFCSQYEFFTWDLENTTFPWIIVGSIILLSPVTILMNLLVIVTVAKRRDLQKLSNILLRSLALVDLLVGAVSMPLSATVDVLILRQMPVEYICDLDLANITVLYFLSILSLYHLTVIAWERNVAIRKGLQYRVLVSKSLLVKLSIFAWLVAVFSDLPATILTITEEDVEIIDMWMTIECTLMVICVIIIACYNILVYLGVRKRKKNQIVPLTANQKMESKTAKTCGLLTLVIFSSFLPKLLISIFSEIFPAPLQSNSAFRLTETLVQLNSLLTPLIYWYRDRRFRNAVLEILRLRKPQPIHPPVAARIACRGNPVGTHLNYKEPHFVFDSHSKQHAIKRVLGVHVFFFYLTVNPSRRPQMIPFKKGEEWHSNGSFLKRLTLNAKLKNKEPEKKEDLKMEPDTGETANNNFSTDRSVFFCSQYEFFTWDLENTTFPWIIVGSIILLSPVTILMNLLVIVTIAKRRDLQKLSNILLRSLALVDLLVGAVSMPLSATVDVLILRQMPVEYICDLDLANITVLYFLSVLSLYHLTAIAWERNVAIRKGLQYRVLVSKNLLVKLSIFAWLVAAFTDLPATILTVTEVGTEITDMWMTIECTLMVICVMIIACYNILVYLGVRKRKKNQIVPLTANQKMESKTAKICGLLTLVIFSSFLPKLLISIFSEIFPAPLQSNSAFRLTETLVQLNSLLTPLIYWYRDRRFRNAVLEILRLRKPQPIHPSVAARIACRGSPVGTVAERHD
ncbi:unnamed protein product [Pocillopora meandrina]|uniref:G-protein coupled receptors family 1 profile domain-containing protein n=1 Tax=Pocillopora meandrina TaxID=46732 RepID=A0AAU9WN77_9CNID|nr:unnamed protein product [Pocillopora meandrina]